MMTTKIEWATDSWNPVTGCSKISEGCKNCYAERMAKRLAGRYGYPKDEPFRPGTVHPDKMDNPPNWGGGKKIFVCSMGDLFHDNVPTYKTYGSIFDTAYMSGYGMYMAPRKPDFFIFLTKRPENMLKVVNYYQQRYGGRMPENCWFGVTAENQEQADKRIPVLLQIPAAVHFVSVEPMLSNIWLAPWLFNFEIPEHRNRDGQIVHFEKRESLNWVICGGESGPGARPVHPDWVRSLRDQCQAAGVPFFFKQWGEWVASFPPGISTRGGGTQYAQTHTFQDGMIVTKAGKKAAGRMLDGKTWEEYPK